MEAVKRKLFISLEGLVKGMLDASINVQDLMTGLFYMGCSRSAVDKAMEELSEQDKVIPARLIKQAIFKANLYGRCRWAKMGEKPAYYHLNFLLVDNGYKVLNGYQICSPATYHEYTAENIIRLMAESNPDLEVVP